MAVTTSRDADNDVRQPLLHSHQGAEPAHSYNGTTATNSPTEVTVEFNRNGDPENPQDWPVAFKWSVVMLLSMMAFVTTFTCISMVPLASTIVADLSSNSPPSHPSTTRAAASNVLLVTIWELGEAAGPLLIAPLSELHGRYPIMNIGNTCLILSTVLAATSTTVNQFIFARALTGLSVTANVLNPAIIGDMFPPEKRGSPVSMVYLAPLLGGAIGPGFATMIAERLGSWRAVVWLCVVLAGGCEVCFLIFFRETYRVVLLRRKVARVAREGVVVVAGEDGKQVVVGRRVVAGGEEEVVKVVVEGDAEGTGVDIGRGVGFMGEVQKLRDAVLRPAHVLMGSAVLMALSLLGSVLFSYYYVVSVTLPDILQERYGLSSVQTGWCFISFTVGSVVSVIICETSLDKIYIRMRDACRIRTNNPTADGQPEYRLPLTIFGAFITPIGIAMFGWTAELSLPLPLLLFSVSLMGAAVMLTVIPLMAYIVDAFGLYSASAITGVIVTRCLMGTFLPLATGPLIDNYGHGWGFTVFAALSLVLAPITIIIFRYGERWRTFSRYTRENM